MIPLQIETLDFGVPLGVRRFELTNMRMAVVDGLLRKNSINLNCVQLCNTMVAVARSFKSRDLDEAAQGLELLSTFPIDVLSIFLAGTCVEGVTPRQVLESFDREPDLSALGAVTLLNLLSNYFARVGASAEKKRRMANSPPATPPSSSGGVDNASPPTANSVAG